MTNQHEKQILAEIERKAFCRGIYIRTLFDPVQTHAIYNVRREYLTEVKEILKEHKMTRLRVRMIDKYSCIVCFKNKNNDNPQTKS